MYTCICTCIYACTYTCMYTCMYSCMYIYIYIYINVYINTCAPPARVRLCKGPCRRVRIREHALAHR